MLLREYELTVIANPQLTPDKSTKTFEKYESMLLADGGEIIKKAAWGTRKLAFPMNQQFRGTYFHYDLTCSPACLKEVERLMRIDDNILRYMSVRLGENVDVEKRRLEIAKAEAFASSQKEIDPQ